jgi:ubiquinone/menaquinone biosynthesis C-methylase UbiE
MDRILRIIFRLIPKTIRRWIINSCTRVEVHEPAEDALCYLLSLDSLVYQLSGFKSIEYNGNQQIKHRVTGYHDFFVNRIKPGEQVMDIGCGKGELAYQIVTKAGGSVVGIDLNEQWLNSARKNYQHSELEFILEDAEKFIPPKKCDTVIMSNVLEHIENRVPFLKKIIKQVQPSRILIRVPMFNRDWRVPLRKELGLPYFLDTGHFIEYTQESFAMEMKSAGLCIAHSEVRWGEYWTEVVPSA